MYFLAGDIGGTKTLIGLFSSKGKELKLERQERYVSNDHLTLEDIITLFLQGVKIQVHAACFGIAGPIEDGVAHATNLPWVVKAVSLEKQFHIEKVYLINDLRANAYGIQILKEKDFFTLNRGKRVETGNQALISAGTGLGEAPIFYHEGELIPSSSEGGHVDFSPRDQREVELFIYLKEKFGHVSYERVLSGQGLINLYHFLVDTQKYKSLPKVQEAMRKEDPGKVISDFALAKKCPACEEALHWFSSLYGAEAGNFALKVMALGGVLIGGGIAPKVLSVLKQGAFMKAFKDKGRLSTMLGDIPIRVVLDENTALKGSAYFCQTRSQEAIEGKKIKKGK